MPRLGRPEAEATRLLEATGQQGSNPIDIAPVACQLGLKVRYERMDEISGATYRRGSSATVVVNSGHSRVRQRFTLAHEIGHVILHKGRQLVLDPDTRVSYRDDLSSLASDTEEIEANRFGASLLMPSGRVLQEVTEVAAAGRVNAGDLALLLSRRFEVSEQAMLYRLVNLGHLDVGVLGEA